MVRQIPVGIISGYGGGPQGYRPLVEAVASYGYETRLFSSQRRGGSCVAKGYPRALVRQAEAVVEMAEQQGIDEMVLIGHSMGAAIAGVVALLRPELVARLIMVCPASIHPDNPIALAYRLIRKGGDEKRYMQQVDGQELAIMQAAKRESTRYVLQAPLRSLSEGWTLGRFSVVNASRQSAVETWYVLGLLDPLFRSERLRAALTHVQPDRILELAIWHDVQKVPAQSARLANVLHKRKLLLAP